VEDLDAGGDVDDSAFDQVEVGQVDDADLVGADAAGGEGRDLGVDEGAEGDASGGASTPGQDLADEAGAGVGVVELDVEGAA
jgi:hypothetical protein